LFLPDTNFDKCFQSNDVESVWNELKLIIYDAMHLLIPKVKINSSRNPKWFTPSIRHCLNCLRTLQRKFIKHPTEYVTFKISTLENYLNLPMARAKSDYEANLINTYAPTNDTIYQYINTITGQINIPITVNYRSSSTTTDQDKASLFNLYILSMFTQSTFILLSDLHQNIAVRTLLFLKAMCIRFSVILIP